MEGFSGVNGAIVRSKLSASADKSQIAVVSAIAAGMAAQFGVAVGLLVPFIALCLIVLVRTGKEAFCSTLEWDKPLHVCEKPRKRKLSRQKVVED